MTRLSSYKNRAKTLSSYFGASLIPMLLNLAINPFIAKNMSPEDYGITGFYTAFNGLVSPLILFYFIHYYQKKYFEISSDERNYLTALIFKSLIFFSGIISIISIIGMTIYLKYFYIDISFPIFPYLCMTVLTCFFAGLYQFRLSELKMSRRPKAFLRISLIAGISTSILTFLLVVSLKLGAFGKLLGPLLCNFVIFAYILVQGKSYFNVKTKFSSFITIIKFCSPLALGAILGYFANGYDRTYLEGLNDINSYGNYVVGCQIGLYMNVFATAISTTFSPDICESLATHNKSRFWKICFGQISLISIVVIIFIFACPFIISLLTANRYNGAVPYASIVAAASITSSIYYMVNYYSIATNRPQLYLYTTIIGTIIIISLYSPVINNFRYIGGAMMVVSSYVILTIVNLMFLAVLKRKKSTSSSV